MLPMSRKTAHSVELALSAGTPENVVRHDLARQGWSDAQIDKYIQLGNSPITSQSTGAALVLAGTASRQYRAFERAMWLEFLHSIVLDIRNWFKKGKV